MGRMTRALLALPVALFLSVTALFAAEDRESKQFTLTVASSTSTADVTCAKLDVSGMGKASFDVSDTWAGTVTFRVMGASGTMNALNVNKADTGTQVTTTTANGLWSGDVSGYETALACLTSFTSGAPKVTIKAAGTGGGGAGSTLTGDIMISNFATETKQDTQITSLATINTSIAVGNTALSTVNTSIGTGNTALAAIKTSVELLDNAVAGNELQVDVLTLPTVQVQSNSLNLLPGLTLNADTSGQPAALIMAAVTTAAPVYTNLKSSALSLDTDGNLRVIVSGLDIGDVMVDAQPESDPHYVRCSNGTIASPCLVSGTVTVTGVATDAKLDTIITHVDALETIFGTDAIFGTAGTADADVLSVQGIASGTPLATNLSQVNGSAFSATNPVFTCLVSLGDSACMAIPAAQTQDFDTTGSTDTTQIFGIALPSATGAIGVDTNNPLPITPVAGAAIIANGGIAHGSANSGNPVLIGLHARTALPTAEVDGDRVSFMADKIGRAVFTTSPRELRAKGARVSLTSTTTETTIIAAAASTYHDLTYAACTNASATEVRIDWRDDTGGTVQFSMDLAPSGGGNNKAIVDGWPAAAVNKNWTIQASASVASVYCEALARKDN